MSHKRSFLGGTFAAILVCGQAAGGSSVTSGLASWYGGRFEGRRTSSGCIFRSAGLTAASRDLPLGTMLRVSRGDYSVIVQVTDRGPYIQGRVLDLSRAAAEQLEMRNAGVARVAIENLGLAPVYCRR